MRRPAVEIVGVAKQFGETMALDRIDLTIHENEFVSLLGASGCGKTTLLRIVAGFESPSSGRVHSSGEDVTAVPPERRPTNIVFQRGALFPHMNVFDNIAYSLKLGSWPRARIAAKVEEMLALVRLEGLGAVRPTELSGGQIQRVALARALAAEPQGSPARRAPVGPRPQAAAADATRASRHPAETRRDVRLYVTHDQTEALVMSDRIAIMNQGRIVQLGTPREIYTRPASVFASAFIGETNLVRGTVVRTEDRIVTVAVGDGQQVSAEAAGELAPGTRATLAVRPEAIRVTIPRSRESPIRAVTGRLTEIVYLGSKIRIGAVISDGALVWADLRDEEAEGLTVGMPVDLSWPPSAASVWPE